ncbi:uncharacterized protein LOC105664667 isoform X1 [Ceratitis capitata]|nr:uncharacterized protein LOC105664667 isoform X1 [Ceratitis capitata]
MAKLKEFDTIRLDGSAAGAADGLFAMLAYVGIFICMITTLVGIKIWWFKHRLTFEHGRTSNGAAGGATPTVPLRTRRNRDKRMSQEIHEPVEVHGVFRRRQEDDLDIVPTKQLPPVRIRNLSQSTPSLFLIPPTRRQEKVRSAIYEEIDPPTREPPRPPIDSPSPPTREAPCPPINSLTPPHHTPTISLIEEMPTFDELELRYRQMQLEETKAQELSADSVESIRRKQELIPPQPPKRFNRSSYNEEKLAVGMRKFVKTKSTSTEFINRSQEKLNERRATGYFRPDEEPVHSGLLGRKSTLHTAHSLSIEEFGERRPTGYIKYEEIDAEGLSDFRNKWNSLQSGLSADSPLSFQSADRTDYEAMHGHTYDHLNRVSEVELRTVADGEPTTHLDVNTGASTAVRQSWQGERLPDKQDSPESQTSMNFTSDEEFADELDGFKGKSLMKSATVANCSFTAYETAENVHKEPQPLHVEATKNLEGKFADPEHSVQQTTSPWEPEEERTTLKMRRPTGYAQTLQPEHLWDELEANIKQDEREKHLWLEIEKEVELNRDFTRNIEEEFDKIRHSYEENEAAFLESNSNLKRVPEQALITTPEPVGFGKNIEEDWESFENLRADKSKPSDNTAKSVVQFNLSDLEDAYENQSPLRIERRPTGFVPNNVKLQRELSNIEDEDEDVPTSPYHTTSNVDFVNEDNELYAIPARSLKQRRPTAYVHTEITNLEDDYVHEHNKESIFEPAEEPPNTKDGTQTRVRPRPRQKVTFDFSNTEYYQTSYGVEEKEQEAVTKFSTISKHAANDSDSVEEDEPVPTTSFPTPMQRITKIHYAAETYDSTPAGLRGTSPTLSQAPGPLPFSAQVALQVAESDINGSWTAIKQATSTSTESTQSTVISVAEPPKPADRNPLAQTTTVRSITLTEERIVTQSQPQSTFQPHAAARHQYFDQSYYNSTEA